jgi:hypothetical protein
MANQQQAHDGGAPERRKQWSFAIRDDGSWAWKVVNPDGSEADSERTFKTLKECTEDAARNGYVVWKTEEERRRHGG